MNYMEIEIRSVNVKDTTYETDLKEIIKIKYDIWKQLPDKDLFVIDGTTEEYINKAILNNGLLLKAVDKNNSKIIGFLLASRVIRINSEIMQAFQHANIEEYMEIDTVGILSEYRGMRLQQKMLLEAEKIMVSRDKTIKYSIGTVHPNNAPSLKSFLNMGYKIVDERDMYNNKRRYVVKKEV